jgi:hypothetical protein
MQLCQIACIGKKAQVRKSTNFDAGLYDITTFGRVCIISIYHQPLIFGFWHTISPHAKTIDND